VLPNTTTETQNTGNGNFSGIELSVGAPIGRTLRAGGNYTFTHGRSRTRYNLVSAPRAVPSNRAFLWTTWLLTSPLRITPSFEVADNRWSDVNPASAFPYLKTGAYALLELRRDIRVRATSRGEPRVQECAGRLLRARVGQQGRTFYVKTQMQY